MPGGFTPPEQIKYRGVPTGQRRVGLAMAAVRSW